MIFEVLYGEFLPTYIPQMIMNITQKFMSADEELQSDINMLLEITSSVELTDPRVSASSTPVSEGSPRGADGEEEGEWFEPLELPGWW